MAVSSEQIAKIAGVSRSTVSKVIHNYQEIPEETRQRVLKVIKEYGYTSHYLSHNAAKANNDSASPKIIGLYFYMPTLYSFINSGRSHSGFGSAYDTSLLSAITLEAQKRGYMVTFNLINSALGQDNIRKQVCDAFNEKKICAAVFLDLDDDATFVEDLASSDRHIIVVDKFINTTKGIRCILANDYNSARRATEVLIENGYRNVLHISGEQSKLSARERVRGYTDYIESYRAEQRRRIKAGGSDIELIAPPKVLHGLYSMEHGYEAGLRFLDEKLYETYDGILCACDPIAIGFLTCLRHRNSDLIDRLGLIGFDNEAVGMFTSPTISSMVLNFQTLARFILDFEENYDSFNGGISIKIDHDLVMRESSMPRDVRNNLLKDRKR